MASLESVINTNNLHSVILRGLLRNDHEDEFLKLIRLRFGISSFHAENPIHMDHHNENDD